MSQPTPDAVDELVCSARGCRGEATWGVLWNNPRLHTPVRRKVWLACDAHREHLEEYLRVRAFWKDTVPVSDLPHVDQGARLGGLGGFGAPGGLGGPDRLGELRRPDDAGGTGRPEAGS